MIRLMCVTSIAVVLASVPSAAQNLLVNPGFEDQGGSYDGWFTFGNGPQLSLPGGDNIIRTGMAAAKIFGEFTDCPNPQFDVGGFGQAFIPTTGETYELSGWSFISSGDPIPGDSTCDGNRLLAQIAFFDAATGGAVIASNEVVIGDFATAQDEWLPFTVQSAPAPAGALRVEALFLFLQPGCDTGAVFVDDTSFEAMTPTSDPNLLANPSFDTNLDGWNPFGNVFHDQRAFAVHTPTGSAKLFSTFAAGEDSGIFQSFPATPGFEWHFDVHVMTTCVEDPIAGTNDNLVLAKIVFRDGGGTEIDAVDSVIRDATSPLGTWVKHSLIGTAPTGAATAEAFILFVSPSLLGGAAWVDDLSLQEVDPIGIAVLPAPAPPALELRQNVPNPFNPSTRIDFNLEHRGVVDLSVFDSQGRWVTTLVEGLMSEGLHSIRWGGTSANGAQVASGVYRYVLRGTGGTVARSMLLVR